MTIRYGVEEERKIGDKKRRGERKRPRSRGDGNREVVRFGLWPTLTVTGVWDHLACVCASVCVQACVCVYVSCQVSGLLSPASVEDSRKEVLSFSQKRKRERNWVLSANQ